MGLLFWFLPVVQLEIDPAEIDPAEIDPAGSKPKQVGAIIRRIVGAWGRSPHQRASPLHSLTSSSVESSPATYIDQKYFKPMTESRSGYVTIRPGFVGQCC
jgi:hypothetical protein